MCFKFYSYIKPGLGTRLNFLDNDAHKKDIFIRHAEYYIHSDNRKSNS